MDYLKTKIGIFLRVINILVNGNSLKVQHFKWAKMTII